MSQTTPSDTTTTTAPQLREPTEDLHYIAPTELVERYGVSLSGLAKWHKEGKVAALRTPGGHRRYAAEHVRQLLGLPAAARRQRKINVKSLQEKRLVWKKRVKRRWSEEFCKGRHAYACPTEQCLFKANK
ncbi:Excisionase family DNA binding protein [Balamuthia mandrillaris]